MLNDDLRMAPSLHVADVVEPGVLQQLAHLAVPEQGLAQLNAEARPKEALHVREHDHARMALGPRATQDFSQDRARFTPCCSWHRLIRPPAQCGDLLPQSALLLLTCDRAATRNHAAIHVGKKFPLRHRHLHDVADLAQHAALQTRQATTDEYLRASIATAGKHRLAGGQALQVLRECVPHLNGVGIHSAAHIDEVLLAPGQEHRVLFALLGLQQEALASLANIPQALGINKRSRVDIHDGVLVSGGARRLLRRGGVTLADAPEHDPPEGFQPVSVEALHRSHDLRDPRPYIPRLRAPHLIIQACQAGTLMSDKRFAPARPCNMLPSIRGRTLQHPLTLLLGGHLR